MFGATTAIWRGCMRRSMGVGAWRAKLPADGVSGATRAPGAHRIAIPANVKPGTYTLFVEASREDGGRELVSMPLEIPARAGKASGKTELGAIVVKPR